MSTLQTDWRVNSCSKRLKEGKEDRDSPQGGTGPLKSLELANQSLRKDSTYVFPMEVMEKIISRMPFPSLFKCKLLSKTWRDNLGLSSEGTPSSLSSEGTASSSLTQFQKEVTTVSTNWTTYSPVFFSKEGILGFDRVSSRWKSLFSLSHLPLTDWSSISSPSCVGSLICMGPEHIDDKRGPVFITNVVTRSWRALQIPPDLLAYECVRTYPPNHVKFASECVRTYPPNHVKLVPGDRPDSFKLFLLFSGYRKGISFICTVVYDSSLDRWSKCYSYGDHPKPSVCQKYKSCFFPDSVYLHGKLYCITGYKYNPTALWVHDTNPDTKRCWILIGALLAAPSFIEDAPSFIEDAGVLLCGQRIMVVFWKKMVEKKHDVGDEVGEEVSARGSNFPLRYRIRICEVHPDKLHLGTVCEGPPQVMSSADLWLGVQKDKIRFTSDDDFIYFNQTNIPGKAILTYNVHNGEWGCLPPPRCGLGTRANEYGFGSMNNETTTMLGSTFSPGLNPFASV